MARSLVTAARHPDCEALLDRLQVVESPPWPQLWGALIEIRGAGREAGLERSGSAEPAEMGQPLPLLLVQRQRRVVL
jgi:hypothetical protein